MGLPLNMLNSKCLVDIGNKHVWYDVFNPEDDDVSFLSLPCKTLQLPAGDMWWNPAIVKTTPL